MTTAVLIISCLLSAALGVGAAVLTSLVRKSLEVRAADLAQLKERGEHVPRARVSVLVRAEPLLRTMDCRGLCPPRLRAL